MHLKGERFAVLGMGVSGKAAAHFLLKRGAQVLAVDAKVPQWRQDPSALGDLYGQIQLWDEADPLDLGGYKALILSPGVSPSHPLCQAARAAGVEILGEIELACRFITSRCVGVTGTNGKTTVTQWIAHVLNRAGIAACAVGNVGYPLCTAVDEVPAGAVLVIELSSWQLETMSSPVLDAAVVLNVTPDHLDRHGTMELYAAAKFQIARCLKPSAVWAVDDHTGRDFAALLTTYPPHQTFGFSSDADYYSDGQAVYERKSLAYYLSNGYRGTLSHDVANQLAVYFVARALGLSAESFCHAVEFFSKPPHRNELVRVRRGVRYINDSKGTNLDAVVKAVNGDSATCLLIAGGRGKGVPFTPWLEQFVPGRVRHVYAIGETALEIQQQLVPHLPVTLCSSLQEAVATAAEASQPGERVLLSPGCASLDMFEGYAHRGQVFVKSVKALPD